MSEAGQDALFSNSTSPSDLPSEAVLQIGGAGCSSAVFQAAAFALAHCSFRRSPRFLHQRLGIVAEASERPSARTSLAFKLLLSRGVMGKYVGGRTWPLPVAWTSASLSGIPKLFHRSTVSSKTSFNLLVFSNSALSILHLSRCSCDSFSS